MHVRLACAAGGVVVSGVLLVAASSPALAAPCDAYSQVCPSTPASPISGDNGGPAVVPTATGVPTTTTAPASPGGGTTLPFTGAELVLITAVGAAALAGGTVLVIAGRRRRSAA